MTALDVIEGRKPWSVDASDNLKWMGSLPADCCSLAMCSPPYSSQRTYSIDFKLEGQDWVDFMIPRVVEMCRITDGLVCINMSGPVKDHKYRPVVEWLVADLTRNHGIVCGPAPYVFFRYGIPGSGGMHYHRRDWEPVYCFCRPDVLPLSWSCNTAMGHPPKWAPGGEMSNRMKGGGRVNQWGKCGGPQGMGNKDRNGEKENTARPSHKSANQDNVTLGLFGPVEQPTADPFGHERATSSGRRANGEKKSPKKVVAKPREGMHSQESTGYDLPAIANPGSVIKAFYDAETVRKMLSDLVSRQIDPGDVLRILVGGGLMGHPLCHKNEAPFPESLAEFFISSYAKPGSIVVDPFAGSGTTGAVAIRHGRRFIGCDIREGQVEIARTRIATETPDMFAKGDKP